MGGCSVLKVEDRVECYIYLPSLRTDDPAWQDSGDVP